MRGVNISNNGKQILAVDDHSTIWQFVSPHRVLDFLPIVWSVLQQRDRSRMDQPMQNRPRVDCFDRRSSTHGVSEHKV